MTSSRGGSWCHFNPRTPLQSAMLHSSGGFFVCKISIHALHYRVRLSVSLSPTMAVDTFQSTHSITECDLAMTDDRIVGEGFQSTHSITECDYRSQNAPKRKQRFQSTHSITECDIVPFGWLSMHPYFNPRTPLQSAIIHFYPASSIRPFQSTHSITECDIGVISTTIARCRLFQSTHSITECDSSFFRRSSDLCHFNPRTPLQSAISIVVWIRNWIKISIHALHYRVR